jgi:hypothetical protein
MKNLSKYISLHVDVNICYVKEFCANFLLRSHQYIHKR